MIAVPARIGSKGLAKKNILNLCGMPLIHHTIKSAIKSKLIDRIILTTDSQEIVDKCKCFKQVEIPFLDLKNCQLINQQL